MNTCEPKMRELIAIKKELEALVKTETSANSENARKLKAIDCQIKRRTEED